jgi:hypothetical protein
LSDVLLAAKGACECGEWGVRTMKHRVSRSSQLQQEWFGIGNILLDFRCADAAARAQEPAQNRSRQLTISAPCMCST